MYLVFCWIIVPIVVNVLIAIFRPEWHREYAEKRWEKEKHRRPLTKEEQEAIYVAIMTSEMYNSSHK